MAFEMTHNSIQAWAWPLHGICARNTYCLGVAHRLKDIARAERRAAERAATENEAKSTAAKTTPLSSPFQRTSVLEMDSDTDSEKISRKQLHPSRFQHNKDISIPDITRPFEAELQKSANATPRPPKDPTTPEARRKIEWTSSTQLTIYRQNIAKITEDVLKVNDVKPYADKKRKKSVKDEGQYARKVDVRGGITEDGRA